LFIFFNHLSVIKKPMSQALLIPLILVPFMLSWNHEIEIFGFFLIPIVMRIAKYTLIPSIILIILFPFIAMMTNIENFINDILFIFNFKYDRIFLPTLPWYGIIIYLIIIV